VSEFPLLLDPNIVYLVLVVGLWLSITAIHIPGTGIIEFLAAGGVIGALALLSQQAVNWVSVIVLVVGVLVFLVLPYVDRRFALVSLGGLAMQAYGGLTLFNTAAVSPILVALTVGLSLLYYRFALIPALDSQRTRPAMLDDTPIVGMRGRVKSNIDPVGSVLVQGETWSARLADGTDEPIQAGAEVIVVEREGLTLYVEPVKPKRRPSQDGETDVESTDPISTEPAV